MSAAEPNAATIPARGARLGSTWGAGEVAAVSLIVISAFLARIYAIDSNGLELDDFWNAQLSTGRGTVHETVEINLIYHPPAATALSGAPPWWRIAATLENVTHPPLFSIVLRFWRSIAGEGDVPMRVLGALLSSAAIVPLYGVVRALSGRTAALWAAVLFAIATVPVMVAQQVRPYNLLILLELIALWIAVHLTPGKAGWWRLTAFAGVCLAATLTHYFAVPMLAGVWIFAALRLDREGNRRLAVAVGLAALTFLILWGPTLARQVSTMRQSANIWLKDRSPHPALATIGRFTEIPGRLIMTPAPSLPWASQLSILLILTAGVLARQRRDLVCYLLLFLGTAGFVALLDLLQTTRMQ
ncbi:MAG: glycosyltransferase family 39 protein, partial [Phycisphaerae bacterium]|nr:glycosyltransferase family 39 protein [Phycisphaerae bacterium]